MFLASSLMRESNWCYYNSRQRPIDSFKQNITIQREILVTCGQPCDAKTCKAVISVRRQVPVITCTWSSSRCNLAQHRSQWVPLKSTCKNDFGRDFSKTTMALYPIYYYIYLAPLRSSNHASNLPGQL